MPSLDEIKTNIGQKVTDQNSGSTESVKSKIPDIIVGVDGSEIKVEDLTESDILKYASIVARPLGMFDGLDVKPIRKEFAYRWVNRKGQGGANYQKFLSIGFVNAEVGDIELKDSNLIRDGVIATHDVILMKIPKIIYFGFLKNNVVRAMATTSKKELDKIGLVEGQKVIGGIRAPAEYDISKKVGIYNPPLGELNK